MPTPEPGQAALFMDEYGHLCVKRPDGTVDYVVLTTTSPENAAQIMAPAYYWDPAPVASPEPVIKVPEGDDRTLWDHLDEEE